MTDLSAKLLPCPFCGDPMEDRGYGAIHVNAGDCAIGGYAVDPVKWNTRTRTLAQQALRTTEAGEVVATMHKSEDGKETLFSKGSVPNLMGFSSTPLYAQPPAEGVKVTDAMVKRACKSTDPLLFSGDPQTEHMAASPYKVEHVQNLVRIKIRTALEAALEHQP